jgi:hypothetical protein
MPTPVTVEELQAAILKLIAERFKGRHLDIDTARKALSLAAYELNILHLKEVEKKEREK